MLLVGLQSHYIWFGLGRIVNTGNAPIFSASPAQGDYRRDLIEYRRLGTSTGGLGRRYLLPSRHEAYVHDGPT